VIKISSVKNVSAIGPKIFLLCTQPKEKVLCAYFVPMMLYMLINKIPDCKQQWSLICLLNGFLYISCTCCIDSILITIYLNDPAYNLKKKHQSQIIKFPGSLISLLECWYIYFVWYLTRTPFQILCLCLSHFTIRKCCDERSSGLTGQAKMPECLGVSSTCQMVSGWLFVIIYCYYNPLQVSFGTPATYWFLCAIKWGYCLRLIVWSTWVNLGLSD
jgi:hypothetical protein